MLDWIASKFGGVEGDRTDRFLSIFSYIDSVSAIKDFNKGGTVYDSYEEATGSGSKKVKAVNGKFVVEVEK